MLIAVDWGGTRIEIMALTPEVIGFSTFTTVFITPIVRAAHGPSSGVRGAAWLWAED